MGSDLIRGLIPHRKPIGPCFDPRSRTGSDLRSRRSRPSRRTGFDPRFPHGERRSRREPSSGRLRRFRSTLPHEERPSGAGRSIHFPLRFPALGPPSCIGFDPRSRMGSDLNKPSPDTVLPMSEFRSTPPAWGATGTLTADLRDLFEQAQSVSIHAPAWGATRPLTGRWRGRTCGFDPRSRMGSDVGYAQDDAVERGAGSFNPRSRMGSDPDRRKRAPLVEDAGSTLPHGERGAPKNTRALAGQRYRWFRSTLPHGERLMICVGNRIRQCKF